jgi:hypothetical protein
VSQKQRVAQLYAQKLCLSCHKSSLFSTVIKIELNIGCSFKFILKVGVEESIVKASRISSQLFKSNLTIYVICVQCDQKENKSEQALQIIGHVVAEFCANKGSMHGCRQFVVSNAIL